MRAQRVIGVGARDDAAQLRPGAECERTGAGRKTEPVNAAGRISAAGRHRETGQRRIREAHRARHGVGGEDGREQVGTHVAGLQRRGAPGARDEVVEQRAARVGGVGRHLAGELQPQPVLRLQGPSRPRERIGLVLGKPRERHAREAGEGGRAEARQLRAAEVLRDATCLRGTARVGPRDRRTHGSAMGIAQHDTVHLTAQADRIRRGIAAGKCFARGVECGSKPRLWVGLRPARLTGVDGVGTHGRGEDFSVGGDHGDLDRLGPQVDPDDATHGHILPR